MYSLHSPTHPPTHTIGKKQVIFFEPNGLRHRDFPLREVEEEEEVGLLSWSADTGLLALCIHSPSSSSSSSSSSSTSSSGGEGAASSSSSSSRVQVWHRNNYHWYLKYELRVGGEGGGGGGEGGWVVASLRFDAEVLGRLHLVLSSSSSSSSSSSCVEWRTLDLGWDVVVSGSRRRQTVGGWVGWVGGWIGWVNGLVVFFSSFCFVFSLSTLFTHPPTLV